MKYLFYITGLFLLCSTTLFGQNIKWTAFDNLKDSIRQEKKPLFIYIYTDWCKVCKMQENGSFKDSTLVAQLNSKYYCLKLNGEEKNNILFLNRNYKFNSQKGNHELAAILGSFKGQLVFPTIVLLNSFFEVNSQLSGLQELSTILSTISHK